MVDMQDGREESSRAGDPAEVSDVGPERHWYDVFDNPRVWYCSRSAALDIMQIYQINLTSI